MEFKSLLPPVLSEYENAKKKRQTLEDELGYITLTQRSELAADTRYARYYDLLTQQAKALDAYIDVVADKLHCLSKILVKEGMRTVAEDKPCPCKEEKVKEETPKPAEPKKCKEKKEEKKVEKEEETSDIDIVAILQEVLEELSKEEEEEEKD